ncbi:MAG: hypothetical protein ABIG30_03730 [Candidatus Aenigmatarchaeota archaeon]
MTPNDKPTDDVRTMLDRLKVYAGAVGELTEAVGSRPSEPEVALSRINSALRAATIAYSAKLDEQTLNTRLPYDPSDMPPSADVTERLIQYRSALTTAEQEFIDASKRDTVITPASYLFAINTIRNARSHFDGLFPEVSVAMEKPAQPESIVGEIEGMTKPAEPDTQ